MTPYPVCPEDAVLVPSGDATYPWQCGPAADDQALTLSGPWLLGQGDYDPATGWTAYTAVGPASAPLSALPDTSAAPPSADSLAGGLLVLAALVVAAIAGGSR